MLYLWTDSLQSTVAPTFAQVPVDQTIEQTMNWDSNTGGDIVGISINRGTIRHCILTPTEVKSYKYMEKWQVCMMLPVSIAKTLPRTHMKKGENDVHTFMHTIILRAGKSFQIKERN